MAADTEETQARILLRRAIYDKDREALGRLHSIYYSRIKRYIVSRINSIPNAEDLSQNVFLELCKGNSHYDGQRDAEAYLFGIARNLIRHYHRNKRKYLHTVQLEAARDFAISYDAQQYQPPSLKQLRQHLDEAIKQLPPKAKNAIRARLIEGLSPTEAAQKAGCSIQAFYNRFDAALKALEVMRETGRLKVDDTTNLGKKIKK
ncbi:MAG: sigma-70 family RNA polymerase sigma factor [Phycisphaerae bacterium]|nr:sigma-70 family RNA polymerase sigma factor [Phycisphaerae bacterium]